MKRWHEEVSKYRQQWRKLTHRSDPAIGRVEECGSELGRYRKKHALDCGKARCGVCHYHKFYEKSDRHEFEVRSDDSFREQLRELDRK
jgi:hypothetical protein